VLVRHNSLIIHGKVEDQQIMHYNDNKNKYYIGLYEEGLNTKYNMIKFDLCSHLHFKNNISL